MMWEGVGDGDLHVMGTLPGHGRLLLLLCRLLLLLLLLLLLVLLRARARTRRQGTGEERGREERVREGRERTLGCFFLEKKDILLDLEGRMDGMVGAWVRVCVEGAQGGDDGEGGGGRGSGWEGACLLPLRWRCARPVPAQKPTTHAPSFLGAAIDINSDPRSLVGRTQRSL